MSGSGFWEGLDCEEQEFWEHSGQTGSTGNFPNHHNDTYRPASRDPVDYFPEWNEQDERSSIHHEDLGQNSRDNLHRNFNPETAERIHEEKSRNTAVNGGKGHEKTMKESAFRRGGQKRPANLFANSFSRGTKISPYSKSVDCPECNDQVCFGQCLRCEKFQVWDEKDDGLKRCHHEYLDLESRGYYDGTWDDHPENFDPETFESIQEKKQRNEEINREMELKWAEFEREAEEQEKEGDSGYDEYIKNEYDEEEEEEEGCDEDDYGDDEENEHEKENDKDEDDVEDDYGEEKEGDEDEYGEDDEYE